MPGSFLLSSACSAEVGRVEGFVGGVCPALAAKISTGYQQVSYAGDWAFCSALQCKALDEFTSMIVQVASKQCFSSPHRKLY